MASLRNDAFSAQDYDDGEIYRLIPGSTLDVALRNERWINHSERSRRNWIRLMNNGNIVFVGTIISAPRRQLQLVVILQMDDGSNRRWMTETVITLDEFDRFL